MADWLGRARKTTGLLFGTEPTERRRGKRHPCWALCWCSAISLTRSDTAWPARVRDISADGIGLVLTGVIDPGTFLSLELPATPGVRRRPLRARVVRVTPHSATGWVLGCRLSPSLSPAELDALL